MAPAVSGRFLAPGMDGTGSVRLPPTGSGCRRLALPVPVLTESRRDPQPTSTAPARLLGGTFCCRGLRSASSGDPATISSDALSDLLVFRTGQQTGQCTDRVVPQVRPPGSQRFGNLLENELPATRKNPPFLRFSSTTHFSSLHESGSREALETVPGERMLSNLML